MIYPMKIKYILIPILIVFSIHTLIILTEGNNLWADGINEILEDDNAKYSPEISQFVPLLANYSRARFSMNKSNFNNFRSALKKLKSCDFSSDIYFMTDANSKFMLDSDCLHASYEESPSLWVWFAYDKKNEYLYVGHFSH